MPIPPPTKPSDSELILLRCLWRRRQLSAREIHDATSTRTRWAYSTTRKTLERMVTKGLLTIAPVHGIKTFLPVHAKIDIMARLIRHFSKTILDTDEPLPVAMFAHSRLVDESELEELQALLETLDRAEREEG